MTGASRGRGAVPGRGPAPAVEHAAGSRARCRHCRRTLVYVSGVGWVDPAVGGAYDMCDGDPYANHDPH
ncbi:MULTISPECIES: hypothetical protein [unclassified Nocardioides]|uniref:hypothetical protein n=1 Tax=unclassified Nocardioides TaxID=2615069 RepID=UPI00005714E8|nr:MULTISPECIES: hypothetical protein [unclassified Nocardioides]